MRLIIAGGRTMRPTDATVDAWVSEAVKRFGIGPVTCVLSGGAQGIDRAGERWAHQRGIPVERFAPDWGQHGKAAGPIRNRMMVLKGDALVCCWDGHSRGSRSVLDAAQTRGIPVLEVVWPAGWGSPAQFVARVGREGVGLH